MNKIILAIIIIAALALGFVAGAVFQMQKDKPDVQVVEKLNTRVSLAMNAYGQVADISGRNVTLSSGSDTLTIRIGDNAKITAQVAGKDGIYVTGKDMAFGDLKKGQTLNINFRIMPDNSLESSSVLVFFRQ